MIITSVVLTLVSPIVKASPNLGINLTALTFNNDSSDVSLGAVTGTLGYAFDLGHKDRRIIPQLRIGSGVHGDEVSGGQIEIDVHSFAAASVRAVYDMSDNISIFIQPSYARLELEVTSAVGTDTDHEWEAGFGGGMAFHFTSALTLEVMYERFNDVDAFTAGFRVNF